MFEKTLTDLVKGIRTNKNNEDAFIRNAITEIRTEVSSGDVKKKAVAVQKLIYLNMLGFSMEWAAFNVVEVMTSPIFHVKRTGYLAAAQSFTPQTEVNILATQTMRKDLKSLNQYEAGMAINGLSTICSQELAKELVSDVVSLMNAQRPYVRKKATLVMYKVFLAYPEALRPSFPVLKDKLGDSHPSVISASVNVICELARKNPKNYLGMAPIFFKLLTTLTNNWTLIKIVKLMGALAPHEPRLAKKLVEPLANIINTTPAKSLLYECLNTATVGMQQHMSIVKLAVEKLKIFVQDSDQNLKYLGLLGLNNLMPEHAKIISDLKDLILDCLDDEDVTIRYRAIDLLCGVVNKKNISAIVSRLFRYAQTSEGEYKNFLVEKIISTCSKNTYENISDFKWYLKLLVDMTELRGVVHGNLIANQLMEVIIRVPAIRPHGITQMVRLLTASHIINESAETSSIFEVLYSASWLVGEFISEANEDPKKVLEGLIQPRLTSIPPRIQAAYVQAIIKLYASVATNKKLEQHQGTSTGGNQDMDFVLSDEPVVNQEEMYKGEKSKKLAEMRRLIRRGFDEFLNVSDVEVQERVVTCLKLLSLHEELFGLGIDIGNQISAIFEEALNPVAKGVQGQVKPPQGLNLEDWIGEPFESDVESLANSWEKDDHEIADETGGYQSSETFDHMQGIGSHRSQFATIDEYQKNKDLFTLKSSKSDTKNDPSVETKSLESLIGKQKGVKKKAVAKKKVKKIEGPIEVMKFEEKPDFYIDPEKSKKLTIENFDPLGSIDLSQPIKSDEKLYQPKAYPTLQEQQEAQKIKEETARREKEKKLRDKKGVSKEVPKDEAKPEGKKKVVTKKGPTKAAKKKPTTERKDDLLELITSDNSVENKPQSSPKNGIQSTPAAVPVAQVTPAKKKAVIKKRRLAKDDNLGISFNPYVMPTDSTTIAIPIYFDAIAPVSNVEFDLETSAGVKLVKEKSGPIRVISNLGASVSHVLSIQIKFSGIEKGLQTSGKVEYTTREGKNKLEFILHLPSSMFMTPKTITSEGLASLMKNKQIPHLASAKFSLPAGKEGCIADINGASREIASLLRLSLVEKMQDVSYQLYGVSIRDHHVAVQTKSNSATQFTVEIRSSDDSMATSLLKEVHHVFKK